MNIQWVFMKSAGVAGLIAQCHMQNESAERNGTSTAGKTFYIGFLIRRRQLTWQCFARSGAVPMPASDGATAPASSLVGGARTATSATLSPTDAAIWLSDDAGDYPAQLRLLQKADGALPLTLPGEAKAIMVNVTPIGSQSSPPHRVAARGVGACFSVTNMLRAECRKVCVRKRARASLSSIT